MALRWAVVAGNWSNPATWNGGTVPGSGDDVRTNNFVVNIDQSISVDRIANYYDPVSPVVQGGRFTITPSVNIVIAIRNGILMLDQAQSNTIFITILPGSGNVTFNVPLLVGSGPTNSGCTVVTPGYTGAITINGNTQGGPRGTALTIQGGATPASLTINGDVLGASEGGSFTQGVSIAGATICHIYGDVIGGLIGGYALNVNAPDITVYVHGEVRGGTGASGVNGIGIQTGSSASNTTTFLYIEGNITGTPGGQAISMWNGRFRASGVEFRGGAVSNTFGPPIQISGTLYATGSEGASPTPGALPVGAFAVITGETLDIYLVDDASYPTSMAGNPVLFTTMSSGTNVPVDGNAGEIEARADGMVFTVVETDPDHVVLTMPEVLASTDIPDVTDQLNEVFAPTTAPSSGWLTVIAKGILGLADSADIGGAPDTVPVAGTVTLTPTLTKPIRRLSTADIFMVSPVVASFDGNGVLSYDGVHDVRIIAPLWSDLSNTTWRWQADVRPGAGQSWAGWSVFFTDAPGATVNLASLLT